MAATDIHTAMIEVMKKVGFVEKSGNMAGKYKFAGEAAFIHAIRPALIEEGIYVYPESIKSHLSETYTTTNGATMNLDKVCTAWRFTHAPSGTSILVEAMGAGADSGDKAIPKALTGSLKYALRQALLIETGDDPDEGDSDNQARGGRRPYSGQMQNPQSRPPLAARLADGPKLPTKEQIDDMMDATGVTVDDMAFALKQDASADFGLPDIHKWMLTGKKSLDDFFGYAMAVRPTS